MVEKRLRDEGVPTYSSRTIWEGISLKLVGRAVEKLDKADIALLLLFLT
jgi:hypothetical protein